MQTYTWHFPTSKNGAIIKPPSYFIFLLGLLNPFWGRHFVGLLALFTFSGFWFGLSKEPEFFKELHKQVLPAIWVVQYYLIIVVSGWYGSWIGLLLGVRNRQYFREARFVTKASVAYLSKFAPGVDPNYYRREVPGGFARTKTQFAYGAYHADCYEYFEQWTIAYRAQRKALRQQEKEMRRKEKEMRKAKAEQAKIAQAKAAVIAPPPSPQPAPAPQPARATKPARNVLRTDPRKFVEEYGYAQGVKGLPLNSGFIEQELKERFGKNFEDYRRAYTIAHSAGAEAFQAGKGPSYKTPAELRGVPLVM
jgi:hypothetical protein